MARKQGTIKIHAEWWDEGEFVEIRSYLSHGAKKAIEAATMEGIDLSKIDFQSGDFSQAQIDLKKTMAAGEDASLLHLIISWNLKDEAGTIWPYAPQEALQQSLNELDDKDTQFVKDALDKLTGAAMSEEERKSFLAMLSAGIVVSNQGTTL